MKTWMRFAVALILGSVLTAGFTQGVHGPNPKSPPSPAQVSPLPQPLIVSVASMPAQNYERPSLFDRMLDPAAILALITVGLVIYTARLASETKRLADEAKETGAKTTRAYVGVSSGQFSVPITSTSTPPELQFDLTNTGQTPARKVEFWYQLVSYPANGDVPLADCLFFPQGSRIKPPQFFPEIGAGKSVPVRYKFTDPTELQKIAAAAAATSTNGGSLIAIEGVVIYRDVFDDEEKKTFFKRILAQNLQGLSATVDHSDST